MNRFVLRVVCVVGVVSLAPNIRRQAAVDADALRVLPVREELRVGNANDPKIGFSAIQFVDVDRDGQVYVFESTEREIRVVSRDGRTLRRIGHRGTGPGEFSSLSGMGVVGDTVWAFDPREGTIHLFRRDGAFIASSRIRLVPQLPREMHAGIAPMALREDRYFLSGVTIPSNVTISDTVMAPRVRFSAKGDLVDTVGYEPIPAQIAASLPASRRIEVAGTSYVVPSPPSDLDLRASLVDGAAFVSRVRVTRDAPGEFTLTRYDLKGQLLHRVRFKYKPGRYAGAVLDTIAMRPVSRLGGESAAFKAIRAALVYPEFQSPVYLMWPANDGSIWLRREDNASANHRWIVIDKSGSVRGVVLLPRTAKPLWASGETAYGVDTDDVGIPWLVRYRVSAR